MKTQPSHNPFPRKEVIFRYGSREISLKELSVENFFAAIELLFNDDIAGFFNFLNIPLEDIRVIASSEELFKGLLKSFLMLHKDEVNGESKEPGTITIEEFFCISTGVVKAFSAMYHVHPGEAGKIYSLRQMIVWLKEDGEGKNQTAGQSRGEGKIPYLPVPSNARNFKEWTDGAGNRCRRWEIEI